MQTIQMITASLAEFKRKVMDIDHCLAMMKNVSFHIMYDLSNF